MVNCKVLLTTHSTAFLNSGGGESELVQVAEILKEAGVQADIYGIGSRPLRFYDSVMHFSVHADGDAILREASQQSMPIFLWPNVWWVESPSSYEVNRIATICASATKVLFKSESELKHFQQFIPLRDEVAIVVPSCVSPRFLEAVDTALAATVCNTTDYALCLGLIEPIKNQLEIVQALKRLPMDGVFVGGARDEAYYERCMEEAHAGVTFLPFIQPCSALLRSIIHGASMVIEISEDPPGRSSLEGAIMEKPLILRDGPWQREHFGENAWYSPEDDPEQLAAIIRFVQHDPNRDLRIKAAKKGVLRRHSSQAIGTQLAKLLVSGL